MPSWTKPAIALSPNMSWPTRATKVTAPPARAAATAWLAPLPPAAAGKLPAEDGFTRPGMRSNSDDHVGVRTADDNDVWFGHSEWVAERRQSLWHYRITAPP